MATPPQPPGPKKITTDTLEETRKAAMQSAVNLLEIVAHAKRQRRPDPSRGPRAASDKNKDPEQGDFLFDLVRLNARYLNQLATIGKVNSQLAQRTLERFYSLIAPTERITASAEIVFEHSTTTSIVVHNDAHPAAHEMHLCWERIEPPLLEYPKQWLSKVNGKDVEQVHETTIALPIGKEMTVDLEIVGKLPVDRTYTSTLVIRLGDSEKRVPVRIVWKKP